ncbi:uncharacterized protein LOC123308561 [Coccinella septempunctata]|uniref:uncharacterized protein LOC123308561 n=1 Tax=Coccinella septempunctata TaxID=41139 RepID=UPI001D0652E8|nr:uncharacterized protein LOC123308561 [Coccinella septempunctata]
MHNRRLQQTFDSYGKPLASSTFIRNDKEKPSYDDRNARNKHMEYDALREGIVKKKISFWDEHSRKFAEKHGFVDIPKKKILKTFKLVKSGIYSCSGPHPGFHFISSGTVTSTGSSGYITTSNRVTSISTPSSESGIESNEEQHVDEDAVKSDEKAKYPTKSFRDIGVNTSYQKQQILNNYEEKRESTESSKEVLDWNDLVAFKEEIFQMNADFMAEVSREEPREVQPTRNLLSRINRTVTMYTKEMVIFYVFFRIATIILFFLW